MQAAAISSRRCPFPKEGGSIRGCALETVVGNRKRLLFFSPLDRESARRLKPSEPEPEA